MTEPYTPWEWTEEVATLIQVCDTNATHIILVGCPMRSGTRKNKTTLALQSAVIYEGCFHQPNLEHRLWGVEPHYGPKEKNK